MAAEDLGARVERPGFAVPDGADALRLQQLARVNAELGAAETMADVVDAAVTHALTAIGAAVSALLLTEGDHLRLVAGEGLRPGVPERWASTPLEAANPASDAARTGRPLWFADAAAVEAAYPRMRGELPAGRSLVCLPLGQTMPSAGVIGLTFDGGWVPGPVELNFLSAYADACGQAVRRVQASAEARLRDERLAYLARVSAELAASLDYRRTLTNVANLTVPVLADWCAVDIAGEAGPSTLAVAHVNPEMVRWAWELQERYPPDPDAPSGAPNVIRTGVSELYPEITDEMLGAGARDEEHLHLARGLAMRSALVVPLAARGRTLGAMTLVRTGSAAPYGVPDLALAEDVGRRAGVAIDNAELYRQSQDVALQLQRAVLPERLDTVPSWEIASHYAPGGRSGVGGDFYDAIALPGRGVAVVVGDVMGHGVRAAATMAQVRSAIRAFLSIDADPAAVIGKLDLMYGRLQITQLVTLVYGVLDPAAKRLSFVNAGHFPPVLVPADGRASFVRTAPRRPVGAGGDDRTPSEVRFDASDTLLLYTDGLVERRREVIDVGLERLLGAAGRLAGRRLADGIAELVEALPAGDLDDDITAFAVRRSSVR